MAYINNPNDAFSFAFNMMKLRYADFDNDIMSIYQCTTPESKINVFINLESVFKIISTIKDCSSIMVLTKDFDTIIASGILNLAGHYKRFFKNNGLDCKVYIYCTDFSSISYNESKYNEDYRSYYHLKYTRNPSFSDVFLRIAKKGLERAKIISEFIPDVHVVIADGIEGSLVPYIIFQSDTDRLNFIITNELIDSLYMTIPNFYVECLKKTHSKGMIAKSPKDILSYITKKSPDDMESICDKFSESNNFIIALGLVGDKIRNLEKVSGVGLATMSNYIDNGVSKQLIPSDVHQWNPIILSVLLDDNKKEMLLNNVSCISIFDGYKRLQPSQISSIQKQIINRFDNVTLINLNNGEFMNHNINLESLL